MNAKRNQIDCKFSVKGLPKLGIRALNTELMCYEDEETCSFRVSNLVNPEDLELHVLYGRGSTPLEAVLDYIKNNMMHHFTLRKLDSGAKQKEE